MCSLDGVALLTIGNLTFIFIYTLCLKTSPTFSTATLKPIISRDQLSSRFHGRDIFREIDLLPWKTLISLKSVIFREF